MKESAEKAAKEKIEEEQRLKALREKVKHPNQQKIDVHEPEKDEITAKDFEMLRAGKKAKEMKKEETELEEATPTAQQVKQGIGIARDKRYAGGNVTGAVKAMDKLNKGLAQHPVVKKELQKQNEAKDTPGQSHQCALHVKSEQFGEGKTIFSQHAEPDEQGNIAWYDVMFEHGIEKQVPTTELEILVSEAHMNHKKKVAEEFDLEEGRGRPRKHPPKPMKKGEDDEDDDYGPDSGPEPDQNIVNHLKKSVDTAGSHDVKFADGSSHKVPAHVAHKVLGAMGKLKPSDRLEVQKHIHANHKNLMDVHRMIK